MNYLILFILCLRAFILSYFTLCFVINKKIRRYLMRFNQITTVTWLYIYNKECEKKSQMSRSANDVLCNVLCSVHIAETYLWHFRAIISCYLLAWLLYCCLASLGRFTYLKQEQAMSCLGGFGFCCCFCTVVCVLFTSWTTVGNFPKSTETFFSGTHDRNNHT